MYEIACVFFKSFFSLWRPIYLPIIFVTLKRKKISNNGITLIASENICSCLEQKACFSVKNFKSYPPKKSIFFSFHFFDEHQGDVATVLAAVVSQYPNAFNLTKPNCLVCYPLWVKLFSKDFRTQCCETAAYLNNY